MKLGRIKLRMRHMRAPFVLLLTAIMLALSLRMCSGMYTRALPYALSQAEAAATTSVSAIINEVLSELSDGISVSLNGCSEENVSGGELRSVTVDSSKINAVRADITSEIIRRLERMRCVVVRVPVGCLTGSDMLFGRGPSIKIKLPARGSVTTDVASSFISAGINQTRHIVSVNIRVALVLSLPDGSVAETKVETTSELAQFVVVGRIPSAVLSP